MSKIYLWFFTFCFLIANENQILIDINFASHSELMQLPLSESKITQIENYLLKVGSISNIYELLDAHGISAEDVYNIKPYIVIGHKEYSEFIANLKRSSYKVDQWLSDEGNTEGLSDFWLDRFYDPRDINKMSFDELSALPNLSPIDVVAVLKQQKMGKIEGDFQLKNAPGLSRWGYKNLIDFIRFPSDEGVSNSEFHWRFTNLVRTVPTTTSPDEEGATSQFLDPSHPELFHRLSMNYGQNLSAGLLQYKHLGNPSNISTEKRSLSIENVDLLGAKLDKLVIGNFTASFGQGVIFESSDYFSPRRTGFGFSKRQDGIYSDLTRSSQFVMDGIASQFSNSFLRVSMFVSKHYRDAIINDDVEPYIDANENGKWDSAEFYTDLNENGQWDETEPFIDTDNNNQWDDSEFFEDFDNNGILDTIPSFTTLITMQPRLPFGVNGDTTKIFHKLTESVEEVTWGGNIRFTPTINTRIGFTFYESLYDRRLIPQVIETITGGADDNNPELDASDYDNYSGDAYYNSYMTNSADPEIAAMYESNGQSPLWDKAQSFRRVTGFDFSTVIGNVSFQGEYGELTKDNEVNPKAVVVSSFFQFSNLNFLLLYRDYDIGYDNPYQRSFSNYQRYKTSIFEDSYWLEDPVYSYLYSGNPQPQAEEGVFFSGRYQFYRSLTATFNIDVWNRKADNAKYFRNVVSLTWRPVFNYRINLRQKWQARGENDIQHPSPFYSRETRLRIQMRMSKYNKIELLYSNGYTTFSPRPRLTDNPYGSEMMVGDIGAPDESIGVSFEHHFDSRFTLKAGSVFISGFLWYFEDTDFRIFNSESGSFHNWISFNVKPVEFMTVRFKFSHSIDAPSTRVTEGQTDAGNWLHNPYVSGENTDFRIQVDYAL
jgi:hypothetical protein